MPPPPKNLALNKRLEEIPEDLNTTRHVHLECLQAQVEFYKNTPPGEFKLPAIPHHWLIVQLADYPSRMLIGAEGKETNIAEGIAHDSIIYFPLSPKQTGRLVTRQGAYTSSYRTT